MARELDPSEVRWMIDHLQRDLFSYRDLRSTCKKWCITIWMGTLIALATGKLVFGPVEASFLLVIPVLLFWLLEGMYGGITIVIERHMRRAEAALLEVSLTPDRVHEVLPTTGRDVESQVGKIKAMFHALFRTETVVALYTSLLVASGVFLMVLNSAGALNREAQQAGAEQPATAPESELEDNQNPKPESKRRSQ